jgi:serine protease Do
MKKFLLILAFLLMPLAAFAESLPDFTDIAEKQGQAVVNISVTRKPSVEAENAIPNNDPTFELFRRFGLPVPRTMPGQPRESHSMGSGFIISSDGVLLTNAHVVQQGGEMLVTLQDKREFKATIIGVDKRTDVAVLKIDATNLPTVTVGNSSKVRVGEWVVAIGSPFGFESSVTKGIVSAKGRSLPNENLVPFIQTDVPINPGNSGGPLFNMKGEVIGINSQIYSRTGGYMGLSFAIPIEVALQVTEQLRANGRVSRGWLGVAIQEVTPELAESFGLAKPAGALISSLEKDSPAEKGGLLVSDIILNFNGKDIKTLQDLPRAVSAAKAGSQATVQVWRKGAEVKLSLALGEMPGDDQASNDKGSSKQAKTGPLGKLGLSLSNLTAEQKQELELNRGVMVDAAEGLAADAGLQKGDVILAVNNFEVKTAAEFSKLLARLPAKKPLALLISRSGRSQFITLKPEQTENGLKSPG